MKDLEALVVLKDLSNEVLQYYITKNKFDEVEKKYKEIEDSKKRLEESLFLIPEHVLNKLELESSYNELEKPEYLNRINMINLVIFAYNLFQKKYENYEMCMNNFFLSVAGKREALSTDDIDFYLLLRHLCLAKQLEKNQDVELLKIIEEYFPSDSRKLYYPDSWSDFNVIVAVKRYREKLQKQSVQEIILISSSSNEVKALHDYVRKRYESIISPKKIESSKRPNAGEPSVSKKPKLGGNTIMPELAVPDLPAEIKEIGQRIIRFRDPNERRLRPDEVGMESIDDEEEKFHSPLGELFVEEELPEEEEVAKEGAEKGEPPIKEKELSIRKEELHEVTAIEVEDVLKVTLIEEKELNDDINRDQLSGEYENETDKNYNNQNQSNDSDSDDSPDTNTPEPSIALTSDSNQNGPGRSIIPPSNDYKDVSPKSLPMIVTMKRKLRKKAEPWSDQEVEALRQGLEAIRRPYWTNILEWAGPALKNRTGPELKDKARTILGAYRRRGLTEPNQLDAFRYVKYPDRNPKYNKVTRKKQN